MSQPVVVQGTSVETPNWSSPNAARPQLVSYGQGGDPEHEPVKSGCKDPIFALLFYINIIAIVVVAVVYGPGAFDDNASSDYYGYIYAVAITAVISLVFSGIGLLVMMRIPETLIKAALIFVVVVSLVWCIICFLSGSLIGGIFGVIFFAISVCYARAVWSRIPFAAVNLTTAITAIKANFGVVAIAFIFTILATGWTFLWTIALAGVYEQTYECDEQTGVCSNPSYGLLFLLLLAFFFGHQVLQNSVHVTVAGVVGTWWVAPEENGCCSRAVCNSFTRTMTTSFGSICFGSLLVAILEALKALAQAARANDDSGIGACIAECILGCLASILEYFNKWAFVYVGVYGYSYLEAGKNVFTLFKNRGWEAVIADDLVGNALLLVSVIVGGIMGGIAIIFTVTTDWFEDAGGNDTAVAFFLGFIVGLTVCTVLLSTIGSAVNTVIVMFADAPAELQNNYPEISQKMRQVWGEMFPGTI